MTTPDDQMNRRRRTNKRILIAGGSALAVIALIVIVGAIAGGSAPNYTVERDDQQFTAVVDFADPADLQAVFDDIVDNNGDLPDGGYHVMINCSTGGTESSDNRLGNGRFAIGSLGAAQTGLAEGDSTFKVVEGHSCPAAG